MSMLFSNQQVYSIHGIPTKRIQLSVVIMTTENNKLIYNNNGLMVLLCHRIQKLNFHSAHNIHENTLPSDGIRSIHINSSSFCVIRSANNVCPVNTLKRSTDRSIQCDYYACHFGFETI